jgi:hypothetical protein
MSEINKERWVRHLAQTVSIRRVNSDVLIARVFGARAKAEAFATLIARAPSMLILLEKAYPIIEEEAERREAAPGGHFIGGYYTEMRELANEIQAEIDRARGKEDKTDD